MCANCEFGDFLLYICYLFLSRNGQFTCDVAISDFSAEKHLVFCRKNSRFEDHVCVLQEFSPKTALIFNLQKIMFCYNLAEINLNFATRIILNCNTKRRARCALQPRLVVLLNLTVANAIGLLTVFASSSFSACVFLPQQHLLQKILFIVEKVSILCYYYNV